MPEERKERLGALGFGLVLGAGIGVLFGVIVGALPVAIAVGAGIGILLGAVIGRSTKTRVKP